MAKVKVYWSDRFEKWWVKVGRKNETSHRKKSVAVDQAVARAKEEKPSKLVIKTKKGKTSDTREYSE